MFQRRLTYLLVLLPTITEYLELGRFPNAPREVITDVVLTAALLALVRRLQGEYSSLVRLSETDPLTGLGNRRKLHHDLTLEVARARRDHSPLTLAFFDLDRFKTINDRFGHDRGDEVLSRLGSLLRQSTRTAGDRWYRFGGDEFVVLLPGTTAAGADEVLARINDLVGELVGAYGAGLSTGLTELEPGDTTATLLQRADRLLYAHKSGKETRTAGTESEPMPSHSPALAGRER